MGIWQRLDFFLHNISDGEKKNQCNSHLMQCILDSLILTVLFKSVLIVYLLEVANKYGTIQSKVLARGPSSGSLAAL